GRFDRAGDEEQMPVIDHSKLRFGDASRQDFAIDGWNQRIVPAHEDEGRLPYRPKPRQAAPTGHREELVEVAQAARASHGAGMPSDQFWVLAKQPTIDLRGDLAHVFPVKIAPGRRHLPHDRGTPRNHDRAGGGRGEHEPPAPSWMLMRELLRQAAAPRDAGDIELFVTKLAGETRS